MRQDATIDPLAPYVPATLLDGGGAPRRSVAGSLVSADISGFTALSERLAARGRRGAEELTDLLNDVFAGMLDAVAAGRGDVLSFGGDAILVLFTGVGHLERAIRAGAAMQAVVASPVVSPTVGEVALGMSVGIHAGTHHLLLVAAGFDALVLVGADASACIRAESAATAGEVLLSPTTAGRVAPAWLGMARDDGTPVRGEAIPEPTDPPSTQPRKDEPTATPAADRARYLPAALVRQLRAGPVHGEHRGVAVGFLAFKGTDRLVADAGVDEVHRRLGRVGAALEVACRRTGANLLATDLGPDGGKFVVAAGAPTSTGDDAAALLRTLREVLDADPGLSLRAGAHRGPVFLGPLGAPARRALTVMGDAVNLAARLAQAAGPGELLASEGILAESRTRFVAEPRPPLQVKGKQAAVRAASVGEIVAGISPTTTDLATDAPGREEELAGLRAHIAVGRPSCAVRVVGAAGMGRSRLLEALCAVSPRPVHRLGADRFERDVPFALARRLLRQVLDLPADADAATAGRGLVAAVAAQAPELLDWLPLIAVPVGADVPPTAVADEIDPRFRARRIEDHASRLVMCVAGPSLVVVEDVDLADDASRRLLEAVASRADDDLAVAADPATAPVVVLSSVGPAERPVGTQVVLAPLDAAAVRRLVLAEVGDLTDHDLARVVATSGGNPMFALAIASALRAGEEVPRSVEDVVTARIDLLGPRDRARVRDLAVLGEEVDVAVAEEVLGAGGAPAGWWEATDGVVARDGSRLRFGHALHQQVAYAGLSWRRRTELHARAADALRDRGAPTAIVGWHELHGGLPARAWASCRTAAEAAARDAAPAAATDLYLRAVEAADALDTPPDDLADVGEALGDVADLAARFAPAATGYELARDRVVAAVDAARLERKLGTLRMRTGDYAAAAAAADAAIAHLETATPRAPGATGPDPRGELAQAHNLHAATAFRRGDYAASAAAAGRAAQLAEAAADEPALAHALWLGDHAAYLDGHPSDGQPSLRAIALLEELEDLVGLANVLNNLGVRAYYDGDWDEAVRRYEHSQAARNRAGDIVGAATQVHNIAEVRADQGRVEEARAGFEEARRVWSAADFSLGSALAAGNLGWVEARLGDVAHGVPRLVAARDRLAELGADALVRDLAVRLAEAEVRAGRPDAALAALDGLDPDDAGVLRLAAVARADLGAAPAVIADALEAAVTAARSGTVVLELGMALLAVADRHPDAGRRPAARAEAEELLVPLGVAVERVRLRPPDAA